MRLKNNTIYNGMKKSNGKKLTKDMQDFCTKNFAEVMKEDLHRQIHCVPGLFR